MSETCGTVVPVTASVDWIARDLIRMARQPATGAEHESLVRMFVGYFDQVYENGKAAAGTCPTREFQQAVQAELAHAYAKHGRDAWSRHELWGVLQEEFEELCDAIKRDLPTEEVLKELRQIACVCQRYAETGDRYRGPHPHVPLRGEAQTAS